MLFKRLDLSVRLFNNSMITVCNIVSVRFFRLAGDEMALQGVFVKSTRLFCLTLYVCPCQGRYVTCACIYVRLTSSRQLPSKVPASISNCCSVCGCSTCVFCPYSRDLVSSVITQQSEVMIY